MKKPVLLLVGPTGVGKTALSLELATVMDCEIVSADSRQIYRYMNIGTAKPTPEQLRQEPHHFIDIRNPDEYYSAGQFSREARQCINDIFSRGRQPMVVGGSGLYIRALVDGLFSPQVSNERVKSALKTRARQQGISVLYEELQKVDPVTASRLNPSDTQRILRAIEVYELTGRPFSEFLEMAPQPAAFEPVFIGLTMERSALYARIERRVDDMLASGFLDEVRVLKGRGYGLHLNALQTVGYKEAFLFLQNDLSYPDMIRLMKQRSRNYAKRQLTWFRKDDRIRWFELTANLSITDISNSIVGTVNRRQLAEK
ncbi:MAG TPA: tRNA (adenosine(37)-N6)-dimethylallyltransferase MiaA [bacterium]